MLSAAAAKSPQSCPTQRDPRGGSSPGSPSLGFSRQEHWRGLPFPSPMHESEVAQSCPTLCNPMDCSLPGFSVHEIFQTRVLSGMPLPSLHPYMTTGKSTALTRWTSDSKVMSLCFNRLVIAFLPRSRHLLASWLQSLSAVILEPRKIKSVTVSIFSPFICHEFNSVQSLSHVRLFATP